MEVDLQKLFDDASAAAGRGEHAEAARLYEACLANAPTGHPPISGEVLRSYYRSAAFNLAQSLLRIGNFVRALEVVELGMHSGPTAIGRAIALAAKGEALCGLGRIGEGKAAFDEAAASHPMIGPMNAADSMSRIASNELLSVARRWSESLMRSQRLDKRRMADVNTTLARVARRQGNINAALQLAATALTLDPSNHDAQLEQNAMLAWRMTRPR